MDEAARKVKLEQYGTYHNAVDDAISQAAHLNRIVRKCGVTLG